MMGFIWGVKDDIENTVEIKSLYVDENFRNRGIARRLKEGLEEWALFNEVNLIKTTVHYKNKKMISLNEKMGYTPGMVNMLKNLKS